MCVKEQAMADHGAGATMMDFLKLDIRVGRVTRAEPYPQARIPAIKLWVDFGAGVGVLRSSAQIAARYAPIDLVGRQVLGVVNFPPRQIGKFMSEALILGVPDATGAIVLIRPDADAPDGARLS
jgi:tRNA-binding protein